MGARRNSSESRSWLLERKDILEKIKDQVRLYLGEESKDLRLYAGSYKRDIMRDWTASDLQSVYSCLQQVQVVFGGDFHPFSQAQRAHLRIMRKVVEDRPLVLALECLFVDQQSYVDQFLAGNISEKQFLRKVQWDSKWGFPWAHYRPFFDFARTHKLPLLGLNVHVEEKDENLHIRDKFAAQALVHYHQRYPEALIYVVYGDLHIAENHLPKALKQAIRPVQPVLDMATLYLNSEHIYFSLAEEGREGKVEVVAYNDRQFCILSSPPWVKWQSYLMYLEENFDADLDFEDEDDDWDFRVDHTDHVSNLVRMICSSLEVHLRTDAIEVYSLQDPQVLKRAQKLLKRHESKLAHQMVRCDSSFYVPSGGFFYLSKATVNHAATLAGQFIHAQLCNRSRVMWDFPQYFVHNIWIEAMGFFLSKMVNPKRKAQTMGDLKKQLQAFDKEDRGREPLLLALDQKMSELLFVYATNDKPSVCVPSDKSSYLLAAHFIGEMLGERYFLLFENQRIGINEVRDLLSLPLDDTAFETFYYHELKRVDRLEIEGDSSI